MRTEKIRYFLLGAVTSLLLFLLVASNGNDQRGRFDLHEGSQGTLVIDTHTGAVLQIDVRGRYFAEGENIPAAVIRRKLEAKE